MALRSLLSRPIGKTVRFRLIGLCVGLMLVFLTSCVLFLMYLKEQRFEHHALEEQERRLTSIGEVGTALLNARQASSAANTARISGDNAAWEERAKVADAKFEEFYKSVELIGSFDPVSRDLILNAARGVWRELSNRAFQEYDSQAQEKPALVEIQTRMASVEATLQASARREAQSCLTLKRSRSPAPARRARTWACGWPSA